MTDAETVIIRFGHWGLAPTPPPEMTSLSEVDPFGPTTFGKSSGVALKQFYPPSSWQKG